MTRPRASERPTPSPIGVEAADAPPWLDELRDGLRCAFGLLAVRYPPAPDERPDAGDGRPSSAPGGAVA